MFCRVTIKLIPTTMTPQEFVLNIEEIIYSR